MRDSRTAALLLGLTLMTASCGDPAERDAPGPAGLLGGWSTAGCEFHREMATTRMGDVVMPATPPDLEAAMARIEEAGRGEFAASFAGLEVDQLTVRAIVHRVPSAAFDDFIRQAADNTCIEVRDAAYNQGDLQTWHDVVVADLPAWSARGVDIVTVAPRHNGSGVEVGVRNLAEAAKSLQVRYGPEAPLIYVEQDPVVPLSASPSVAPHPDSPAAPR
jgi:hypothetical protein